MADYVKKRTHIINHPRFLEAGAVARDLYDWGMLWSGQLETDGEIPMVAVLESSWGAKGKKNVLVAQKLVDVGLWERTDKGYRICKWAEQGNVTKAQLEEQRGAARERMRSRRKPPSSVLSSPHSDHPDQGGVRANFAEPGPPVFAEVPTSTFNSDLRSGSEIKIPEEIPSARARPDPTAPPPPWWDAVLATVGMNTGVDLPGGEAWLRYAGHRAGKALPATQSDGLYWLTTVMVPEARKALGEAARQRDRDAKFDRQRAGPGTTTEPLRETPAQSKAFAEELGRRVAARKAREAKGAA